METSPLAYCANATYPILVDGLVVVPDRGLVGDFLADAFFCSIAG